MSGINFDGHQVRKAAIDVAARILKTRGSDLPPEVAQATDQIARSGGTPLVVLRDQRALGVIHLKDVVKPGIRDRFERIRVMGIKTIMITGDNRLTAQAIAREAGVDDLAEAKPERQASTHPKRSSRRTNGCHVRRWDQRCTRTGPVYVDSS